MTDSEENRTGADETALGPISPVDDEGRPRTDIPIKIDLENPDPRISPEDIAELRELTSTIDPFWTDREVEGEIAAPPPSPSATTDKGDHSR